MFKFDPKGKKLKERAKKERKLSGRQEEDYQKKMSREEAAVRPHLYEDDPGTLTHNENCVVARLSSSSSLEDKKTTLPNRVEDYRRCPRRRHPGRLPH